MNAGGVLRHGYLSRTLPTRAGGVLPTPAHTFSQVWVGLMVVAWKRRFEIGSFPWKLQTSKSTHVV